MQEQISDYHLNSSRKSFRLNLVEPIHLLEETTDAGRYYTTPEGERLRSVTTILKEKMDNKWLLEWKRRVGVIEAKRISNAATKRGSIIHKICEGYVSNDMGYMRSVMPVHAAGFSPIKQVLDDHVDNVYGIEVPLYSLSLKTAGRCDLVGEYDGIPTVIDYKTSKKNKTEDQILSYFIQSTVYSLMFERMYRIIVPQIAIIITVENEPKPLVFVKNRGDYVKKVLEIFTEELL